MRKLAGYIRSLLPSFVIYLHTAAAFLPARTYLFIGFVSFLFTPRERECMSRAAHTLLGAERCVIYSIYVLAVGEKELLYGLFPCGGVRFAREP